MPSTKHDGGSYPTYSLKSRDSVIRNIFLVVFFFFFLHDEIICMHCSLQMKLTYSHRLYSCPCSDTNGGLASVLTHGFSLNVA